MQDFFKTSRHAWSKKFLRWSLESFDSPSLGLYHICWSNIWFNTGLFFGNPSWNVRTLQVGETFEIASSPRAGKKPYDPVNLPNESANETLPSVFRGKEPPYFHCCKLYFGSFFPYVSFLTCFLFGSFLRVGHFFQRSALQASSVTLSSHPRRYLSLQTVVETTQCPEERPTDRMLHATAKDAVIVDHFSSSRWRFSDAKKSEVWWGDRPRYRKVVSNWPPFISQQKANLEGVP